MKKGLKMVAAAAMCLAAVAGSATGHVGTSLTYQGKLKLSGQPVNANADLQFRLFDSSSGGSQVGSTQSHNSVAVQDGLFTRTLDFGTGAFNGSQRWLEVAVRSPAGTGNFVILTPRQQMTPAPYAQVAETSLKPWTASGANAVLVGGKVGVGTNNPSSLVDINGAQDAMRIRGHEPQFTITDSTAGKRAMIQNAGGRLFTMTEAFLAGTDTSGFTMLDAQGRVGIGTFTPSSKVEIAAQDGLTISGFQPFLTLKDMNAGGARAIISTGNGDIGLYSNGAIARQTPSVIIKDNDWMGLGITPAFRLDLPNIANPDGRGRANRWDTYSSARWKENVKTIDNALETVMQLRGVTFDWKKDHGGAHDVGFIAEEVGKVVPELVTWEPDGKTAQGLAYDRVSALTVEAIKAQQRKIESLEQANADLREKLEELTRLVAEQASK